jgi:hypothetical protein
MLPHKHIAISVAVGAAAWWGTGDPVAGAASLATGVLPDVDHIIDYSYYRWRGEHRLILPLHAYEFALLGTVIALLESNNILGWAVLSYFIHLLADQSENRTHKLGYSLLFRAWHRFRIEDISTIPEAAIRGRMEDLELLKSLLRGLRNLTQKKPR